MSETMFGNDRFLLELDQGSALDIRKAWVRGIDISPGDAVPDDGDPRILHAVQGFMFTCGPDHVRHPEPIQGIEGAKYPLHGSMSGHAAEIISEMHTEVVHEIVALIRVRLADGGSASVHRTWRFDVANETFSLVDRVVNDGEASFAPMWMYHMNVSAALFDDGTRFESASLAGGGTGWRFGEGDGHVFCVPVAENDDMEGRVILGPIEKLGNKRLDVRFGADTLSHLQMWRNEAGHCNVIGIEPISHPWLKRTELETMGLLPTLSPGEMREYHLTFCILD